MVSTPKQKWKNKYLIWNHADSLKTKNRHSFESTAAFENARIQTLSSKLLLLGGFVLFFNVVSIFLLSLSLLD